MQQHTKAIITCLLTALLAGLVTQLMSTAGFIRWSAQQGSDYSGEFWSIVSSTWVKGGLTMFLIWAGVSLTAYFILVRLTTLQETAEKIIIRLSIILTVLYSVVMYPNFSDYL
ncbi:MAG: hypothetical protein V7776_18380 [Halopseudomonas aestusnigri]